MSENISGDRQPSPCEICHTQSFGKRISQLIRRVDCPRCGKFEYNTQEGWLGLQSDDHKIRLSGWVRDQNDAGIEFVHITNDISRKAATMPLPPLRERAMRLLKVFSRLYPDIHDNVFVSELAMKPEFLGRSYCASEDSIGTLLAILTDFGFLKEGKNIPTVCLSVKGLLEIESMNSKNANLKQGFVAMSFDPAMDPAWINGFHPGIRAPGYSPFRIDSKEYLGGISDEIISEIRRSRFVVADYTDHRNGVYFEAGFALGLGLPVIPTCREDDVKNLHFDIKHLNTLLWRTPEELADKLAKRIAAVIPN